MYLLAGFLLDKDEHTPSYGSLSSQMKKQNIAVLIKNYVEILIHQDIQDRTE